MFQVPNVCFLHNQETTFVKKTMESFLKAASQLDLLSKRTENEQAPSLPDSIKNPENLLKYPRTLPFGSR